LLNFVGIPERDAWEDESYNYARQTAMMGRICEMLKNPLPHGRVA
jgi:hypothetical protein